MKQYTNVLNLLLIDFQFIEESLKMYISRADKIIEIKVAPYLPYTYNRKDIENFSLGKLVDRYSKISNNTSLIKELRKHMKKRNELAHKGFLFTFEEQNDDLLLIKLTSELESLQVETKKILKIIMEEVSSLEIHLANLSSQ